MLTRTSFAGSFTSRIHKAAFTFAIGGTIFLVSHSILSERATAQLRQPAATSPVLVPNQHRVSPPIIVQRSPVAPIQSRPQPVLINPAMRQEIVAKHADELKREHCTRKLEARRKELLERQALRANPAH